MRTITPFDPSAAPGGTIDAKAANKCAKVTLYNESNIGLLLTFPDGSTAMLPAWWVRTYTLPLSNTAAITWAQAYTLQSNNPPISQVFGEAYEPAEDAPLLNTSLNRQTNIGNQVSTVSNVTAINVVNDGNASGQSVVEATQSGSSGSNVSLLNDGTLTIKEFAASVLTALLQIIPGATTPMKLVAAGRTLEILGGALIDQALTVTGNATVNGAGGLTVAHDATISGNANVTGNVASSGTVSGHTMSISQQPGYQFINTGSGNGAHDSISRWSLFTGTGNATITHNFNSTPDFVIVMYTGNTTPSQVPTWRNATSTQVTINAATGQAWTAIVGTA